MKCIIYKIFTKEEPNTVYVGRTTTSIPSRFSIHKREGKKRKNLSKKNSWIQKQLKLNKKIYVEELECFDTNELGINERETYWINHFLDSGFELLNAGTSSNNKNIVVKETTRSKLSNSIEKSWEEKREKIEINFKDFFNDFYSGLNYSEMSKKYNISSTYVKDLVLGNHRAKETKPYRRR